MNAIIKKIERKSKKRIDRITSLLDLKRYLKNSKKHLDFGCGYGNKTFFFAKKFPKIKVDALDPDKERIKVAKEKYSRKNCSFINSRIISKKYDSISALYVLHEVKNVKKNLKMIFNALKNGGILIVHDFKKNSKKKFRELYRKNKNFEGTFEEEYKEHNKWSMEEFEKMMKSVGFQTLKFKKDRGYWLMYIGQKRLKK
jgi:ubiquinone/menaquinone biosynthesis C-methylase UbiE